MTQEVSRRVVYRSEKYFLFFLEIFLNLILVSPPFNTILFILFMACFASLSDRWYSWSTMAGPVVGSAVDIPAERKALIDRSLFCTSVPDLVSPGLLLALHDSNCSYYKNFTPNNENN